MTCAKRAALALVRHKVEVIFGQSLPSALMLAAEDEGIRQFVYRTENAAGAMADAYARICGKVGVVAAQNGPAATLLVAPLAEALKTSTPVIALVQEVNRPHTDRNAFQELDHLRLFDGCAKWVRRIQDPERIEDYVDMAFVAAATGRPGPAVLLFPADLLNEPAPPPSKRRSASFGRYPMDRTVADGAGVAKAATLLAEAERPLIIAGGGVHGSGAHEELTKLQDTASLPVAYTMMGKGVVSDDHPLTVGLIGNVMGKLSSGRQVEDLVRTADVVFLVGTRTNQNGTDSWSLYPEDAAYIHLDVDGQEVGRNYQADVRLVGDAKLTLHALRQALAGSSLAKRMERRADIEHKVCAARQKRGEMIASVVRSDRSPIRPERLMSELQELLTPDSIIVADASYASVWVNSYLHAVVAGQRFITPRGLAGLGWGFPMALGAKLARPQAPVFCLVGDGGFGHCWAELETAARTDTAVVTIVLNNSVLGYQKDAEAVKFGRYTSACHFGTVDHAAIARACGAHGVRVEAAEDFRSALQDAIERPGPVLIDVMSDPDAFPPLTMFDT